MPRQDELPGLAIKAVRANLATRNARNFDCNERHARMRASRRQTIREWIAVLRVVRNPAVAASVQAALKEAGPLMAHDLRRRVIYAGIEHRLVSFHGQRLKSVVTR